MFITILILIDLNSLIKTPINDQISKIIKITLKFFKFFTAVYRLNLGHIKTYQHIKNSGP